MSDGTYALGEPRFHEPTYVKQWLVSLYLLPVRTQLQAASELRDVVQRADVHEVLDEFIGSTAAELELAGANGGAVGPVDEPREEPITALGILQRWWRASPVLTAFGAAGLALAIAKIGAMIVLALWSLARSG
ncbi:MAG: hypothetical protein AB7L71_02630 [Vicinamibacterales bacterium]